MSQGGVLECAVVGVPDAHSGEAVKLFAVKKAPEPHRSGAAPVLRGQLASYKVPKTHRIPQRIAEDQCRQDPAPRAARRGNAAMTGRDARRRSSRSGARPDRTAGSRRTPRSTTRSARRFLATYEAAAAGKLTDWEAQRGRRAGAAHSARPVSAQHVSRRGARLRHRSAGARGRQPRHPQRLRRRVSRTCAAFSICRSSIRKIWPTRSAALALYKAAGDADGLKWAELHADIIRRFGRFPHRNAVLGRVTHAGGAGVSRRRWLCRVNL